MLAIQVNKRGCLTLPKRLRTALGIERGGVVTVELSSKGITLKPAVAYPIELYSDARVKAFDEEERSLTRRIGRKP